MFTRLDNNGNKIGSEIKVSSSPLTWLYGIPSPVWNGSNYAISWTQGLCLHFAKLNSDGNKAEKDFVLNCSDFNYPYGTSSMASNGFEYAISWDQIYPALMYTNLAGDGNKIGGDLKITYGSSRGSSPSLLWNGKSYALSYSADQYPNNRNSICLIRLDNDKNKIGEDLSVTGETLSGLGNPSLVWTGSNYGVAWHDVRDGNWEIYFNQVSFPK